MSSHTNVRLSDRVAQVVAPMVEITGDPGQAVWDAVQRILADESRSLEHVRPLDGAKPGEYLAEIRFLMSGKDLLGREDPLHTNPGTLAKARELAQRALNGRAESEGFTEFQVVAIKPDSTSGGYEADADYELRIRVAGSLTPAG